VDPQIRGYRGAITEFGYTMMCEQSPPDALVTDIQRAEAAGFDFSQISDHFQPWLAEQGHSPYAWSVLGAAAAVTERIGLMTYVTCPTIRYHPAIVAQKAATVQILSGGRFRLGLGAGENLNEHVVGGGWPAVGSRHSMLSEAVDIIGALFDADDGATVSYHGDHFDLETARLWDRPDQRVEIGIAVSGPESCRLAGRKGDFMVAVQPEAELGQMFDAAGGAGKGRAGQIAVSYDEDRDAAVKRAHEQFRWFGLGWKVMADLPNPDAFDAAAQFVTEADVTETIPCGPDVAEYVEKIKAFVDAGFTEVGLVQIGGSHQEKFIAWAERELLPALRAL
jgi:G6PDH family F420-dependent oxidoreductase